MSAVLLVASNPVTTRQTRGSDEHRSMLLFLKALAMGGVTELWAPAELCSTYRNLLSLPWVEPLSDWKDKGYAAECFEYTLQESAHSSIRPAWPLMLHIQEAQYTSVEHTVVMFTEREELSLSIDSNLIKLSLKSLGLHASEAQTKTFEFDPDVFLEGDHPRNHLLYYVRVETLDTGYLELNLFYLRNATSIPVGDSWRIQRAL